MTSWGRSTRAFEDDVATTSRFRDRTRQRKRAQGIRTVKGAELGPEIREHLGPDVVNSARTR